MKRDTYEKLKDQIFSTWKEYKVNKSFVVQLQSNCWRTLRMLSESSKTIFENRWNIKLRTLTRKLYKKFPQILERSFGKF